MKQRSHFRGIKVSFRATTSVDSVLDTALQESANVMRILSIVMMRIGVRACNNVYKTSKELVAIMEGRKLNPNDISRKECLLPAIVMQYVLENWARVSIDAVDYFKKKRGPVRDFHATANRAAKIKNPIDL